NGTEEREQKKTLKELFTEQLADAYSAENQLVKALPKMAKAAMCDELRGAFERRLEETKEHARRLEWVMKQVGETQKKKCGGMEGLIREGEEIIRDTELDEDTKDAALIAAAQKVEHYEIATYGCLITWADLLGEERV